MNSSKDNSCGVVSVVLGIMSLVTFLIPVLALILAIIGIVFAFCQKKQNNNSWVTAGMWLNGIAIIVGVAWNIFYIKGILEYVQLIQQSGQLGQSAGALESGAYANYGN